MEKLIIMIKSVIMKIVIVVTALLVIALITLIIYRIRGGSVDILDSIFSNLRFIR